MSCFMIQNHKGIQALNYAEKPDFDDEEIEKRDLGSMHSVYGILRKLDIDWKKGEFISKQQMITFSD